MHVCSSPSPLTKHAIIFSELHEVSHYDVTALQNDLGTLHSKKRTTCSGLMKTALNNVVLPTLFKVVNNTEQVDEPELACNQV